MASTRPCTALSGKQIASSFPNAQSVMTHCVICVKPFYACKCHISTLKYQLIIRFPRNT